MSDVDIYYKTKYGVNDLKKFLVILICFSISFCVLADQKEEYRFQIGDSIELFVYGAEDLCGDFRIHADGFIWLPLIGKVKSEGKTKNELFELIQSRIGVYKKNPQIIMEPRFSISVIGYVTNPGVFTITDTERIISTISRAGGFTPDASGKIEIYRNGKTITISRKRILDDNSALGLVKPGDIIYAKRKFISRNDYSIILSTISVLTITIYYSYR